MSGGCQAPHKKKQNKIARRGAAEIKKKLQVPIVFQRVKWLIGIPQKRIQKFRLSLKFISFYNKDADKVEMK